ncbi:hypothetical protein [Tenacibaculum sp. SG-28]|uniref:hypothetical protein n=1 Tax=Tenacibaculum sp. SG-28 TaxID=754426 RepID=UPI000CF371B6|nr:hypothetical protein [Tenacibaculum sp. SG-28]PQJ21184.1 hypothetical protein BSU00_09365 [Tenacibaculum sp. SG-28]
MTRIFLFFFFASICQISFATFTQAGNVITQSGTDNDLSGLNGLSGVSVYTQGTGLDRYVIYDLGNHRLVITGTLYHNPEEEQLLFNNPPNPIVEIANGATYNYGDDVITNGITRQTIGWEFMSLPPIEVVVMLMMLQLQLKMERLGIGKVVQ